MTARSDEERGPPAPWPWHRLLALGLWIGLLLVAAHLLVVYGMDCVWRGQDWETVRLRLSIRGTETTLLALAAGVAAVAAVRRLGRFAGGAAAAGLGFLVVSGAGWEDRNHTLGLGSAQEILVLALMAATGIAGAAAIGFLLRRAPGRSSGFPAALAALILAALLPRALQLAAEPGDEMVVRSTVLELSQAPDRVRVVRSREGAPPRAGVITPGLSHELDLGDLPGMVLPPPSAIEAEVGPEDGPVVFVGAAGIDYQVNHVLEPDDLPAVIRFRALRNGESVFDESVRYESPDSTGARAWHRFEVPLVPGDVLRLETDVELPSPGPAPALPVGFGLCRLDRRSTRSRTRSSPREPNLVLVVMDTLRADRMSLYGYDRPTTPRLDALGARGTVFDEAFATSSWTWPSTASILTGLLPEAHGVWAAESCYLDTSLETVAEALQAGGFTTAAFVGNPLVVADKNFDQGFEQFTATSVRLTYSGQLVPEILEWIERNAGTRFFLYVHLVDTHTPYDPLPEHVERFTQGRPEDYPRYGLSTYARRTRIALSEGRTIEDVVPPEHLRWMSDVYDASVATADTWVGRLLDGLAAAGLEDETVVAFTSDHGEELADHGQLFHGHRLHRELVRVPLILAGPGVPSGVRVPDLVSNRHLAPTLARIGGATLHGPPDPIDLLSEVGREARPVYFSTESGWIAGYSPEGRWAAGPKDQTILGWRDAAWTLHVHLTPEGPRVLGLYDAVADPLERHDLAGADPVRTEHLVETLLERHRGIAARAPRARGAGARTIDALKAIGYAGDE